MVEDSRIRIDEIDLLLAVSVWNKRCVFAIQLQQDLLIWMNEIRWWEENMTTQVKEGNKPHFQEYIEPKKDLKHTC